MCGGKGGGGGRPQVAGTQVVEQRSEFPDEIKPFITDILEKAQARFNQQTESGYPIFPGGVEGRLAPMSAEQTEALEGYRQAGRSGIAGTGMSSARPYYEAGLSALGSSMGAFGPQQAQQYMNPYQQAVVDVAKREAIRSAQPTFRNIGDRAEQTGAFGGSRQAIAEAEANRNLQQQLGDIQTRGMQQAFEQGRAAFEQQKAREAAGAGRMFAQAPQAFRQGLAEMSALEGVGKTTRAEDQRKKNLLYEQFQEEQMYPTKSLAEYQSIVRGFPYQPSMYRTEQNLAPSPGLGQQLLGGLGTAASIYGGMGGFSKGGFGSFGRASGGQVGGIASLARGGQMSRGTRVSNVGSNVGVSSEEFEELLRKKQSGQVLNDEEEAKFQQFSIGDIPSNVTKNVEGVEVVESQSGPQGEFAGLTKAGPPGGIPQLSLDAFGGKDLSKDAQTVKKENERIQRQEYFKNPNISKEGKPVTIGEVSDALRPNLNTLKQLRDFTKEGDKQANRLRALANKQLDVKGRSAKKRAGIGSAYKYLEDYNKKFGVDLTNFTNKQLADNNIFKSEREAAINKRASAKLAKLASMGKDAKKTGEENAMQNLFLNMLLPMSLQAGQDPRGFIAGALQGGQDNMKAFVDRYSSLKDKYATGKEKREREGMDIRDKQQEDIFDMQDKFNTRRDQIESQRFRLQKENDKLIATTGKSKQTELNAVEDSKLAMEAEGLATVTDSLNLQQNILKTKMDISQGNIKAIATLMDAYGIGGSKKTSGKAFKATFDIIRDRIKDKYNYTIDEQTGTVMINGSPLSANQADAKAMQRELSEVLKVGTAVLQGGGTQYQNQVNALQAMLNSLQGGATPNVGFRVTNP